MAHRLPRKHHLPFDEEVTRVQNSLTEISTSLEDGHKAAASLTAPLVQSGTQQGGLFSEYVNHRSEKLDKRLLYVPKPPVPDIIHNAMPKAKFYRKHTQLATIQNIRPQDEEMLRMSSARARKRLKREEAKKLEEQKRQQELQRKVETESEWDLSNQFVLVSVEPSELSKALEPKVMLPFQARPGETPRKIEIERRKRLYALQNIVELLDQEGVQAIHIRPMTYNLVLMKSENDEVEKESVSVSAWDENLLKKLDTDGINNMEGNLEQQSYQIPLTCFDDTEFESRTVDEWLNIKPMTGKVQRTGSVDSTLSDIDEAIRLASIPVPCKVFLLDSWFECYMEAYNDETRQYLVFFKPKEWRKIRDILESAYDDTDLGQKVAETEMLKMWTDRLVKVDLLYKAHKQTILVIFLVSICCFWQKTLPALPNEWLMQLPEDMK
jgi:hypothetical protein